MMTCLDSRTTFENLVSMAVASGNSILWSPCDISSCVPFSTKINKAGGYLVVSGFMETLGGWWEQRARVFTFQEVMPSNLSSSCLETHLFFNTHIHTESRYLSVLTSLWTSQRPALPKSVFNLPFYDLLWGSVYCVCFRISSAARWLETVWTLPIWC